MDLIAPLPQAPHALLEYHNNSPVLVFADSLAIHKNNELRFIECGPLDGAARGPDGRLYCTQGERILCFDLEQEDQIQDITADFAGSPQGRRQVFCSPEGDIWVEGCTTRRHPNGTFGTNPSSPMALPPVPYALDVYGNFWSLAEEPTGRQVIVLPANTPQTWQLAWLPAGEWDHLLADSVGYIWVAGPEGWRRCCPRRMEEGWQKVTDPLPLSAVTAVHFSPDDLLMAAFASGELLEADANAPDQTRIRVLANTPEAAKCIYSSRDGAIWAATDKGLYRQGAATDAWQHNWEKKRGRLPGGGNHDIFSVPCRDRLYVAGGWAGQWGLPPRAHVLDELFVYDSQSEYWQIIDHMNLPRRYNGIATLAGHVWIVGGETRIVGWEGEGQVLYTVDIYDPANTTWSPGPSLNVARTDPFVVSCNERIYAIGGAAHNAGPKLDSVESIGVGESVWRLETPLPEPTRQGHGCALDGIIYCGSIDGVFAFDTASGCWDTDLPQPGPICQAPLVAAYRGKVWLMGGFGDKSTRCFDPLNRTWHSGPDLPTQQAWGAAAVLKNQLIIVGGAHGSTGCDAVVFDDRTYILRDNADDTGV